MEVEGYKYSEWMYGGESFESFVMRGSPSNQSIVCPQAVADFPSLETARKNQIPNPEVEPKIPDNFFVTEKDG